MSYIDKDEFESIVKEAFDNLTQEDFDCLLDEVRLKIRSLKVNGDILINLDGMQFSNNHYELNFNIYRTVLKSNRISFKQYKSLTAFIGKKWNITTNTEYKDFNK